MPSLRVGRPQIDRGERLVGRRLRGDRRRRGARRLGGGRRRPPPRRRDSPAHHEIVAPRIRPPAAADSSARRSTSCSGGLTHGSQSRSPSARTEPRRPRRGGRRSRRSRGRPAAVVGELPRARASSVPTPRSGRPSAAPSAASGGDPDAQAGEGARTEPDRDRLDPLQPPAAVDARPRSPPAARVVWPGLPSAAEAEQGLVEDLAVAPGADGGVLRRGVETEERQARTAP